MRMRMGNLTLRAWRRARKRLAGQGSRVFQLTTAIGPLRGPATGYHCSACPPVIFSVASCVQTQQFAERIQDVS